MNTELYHHGILGQKWGVRRFQNEDGSLTSAGRLRRGITKSGKQEGDVKQSDESNKRCLSDKQKRALKIGAVSVVTALAVYGGYKLSQNENFRAYISKGKKVTGDLLQDNDMNNILRDNSSMDISKSTPVQGISRKAVDIAKSTGLKLKSRATSIDEDLRQVNPDRFTSDGKVNPKYAGNCTSCTIATVMRALGLDVRAVPVPQESRSALQSIGKVFKNAFTNDPLPRKPQQPDKDYAARIERVIAKKYSDAPDGAVGFISIGRHIFNWTKENGSIRTAEGQTPSYNNKYDNQLSSYLSAIFNTESAIKKTNAIGYGRLDNLEVDYGNLLKFVANR